MEIALDSKRLRPDLPVVIRVFDQELAPTPEDLPDGGVGY